MTRGKLISALDIAEELNTGKATIKFLLRRFKKWLPYELVNGMPYYVPEIIKTIIKILEHLETGMLPGEIDKYLDTLSSSDTIHILNPSINLLQNEDIRLNKEGVVLLKSLFSELGEQQKRIAIAHEKRAAAEERKAVAIEKRAEAEEKKAGAMNNIANALQEMNKIRTSGVEPATQQIVHQAANALIIDETDTRYTSIRIDNAYDNPKDSSVFRKMDSDISNLLDEDDLIEEFSKIDELPGSCNTEMEDPLSCLTGVFKTDDLSLLIENEYQEDKNQSGKLNDLSALLESNFKSPEIEIDDLSTLLDKESFESVATEELDDLSSLVDGRHEINRNTKKTILSNLYEPLDDLNKLIGPRHDLMDDLSKLIQTPVEGASRKNVDDLSLLIDIDYHLSNEKPSVIQMDDLSKLINPVENFEPAILMEENSKHIKSIKMDISPEDSIEKYKAAIMKVILELKTDGLTAEETTLLLNKNKIRTLSGKPEWSQKAISQIYKFITSVK